MNIKIKVFSMLMAVAVLFSVFALIPTNAAAEEEHYLSYDADAYQALLTGFLEKPGEAINISAYNVSVSEFSALIQSLRQSEADLFFLNGRYSYSLKGSYVHTVTPGLEYTGEKLTEVRAEYDRLKEELISLASEEMTDIEIALLYHDYLASTYQYDTSYSKYDAYSLMKDGKGVCQAYTLLYSMLMKHYGVPCTYIQSSNINHIWNAVQIDGAWYVVDVTHDDPLYDRPGRVTHTNFLITLEEYFTSSSDHANASLDYLVGQNITLSTANHPNHDFFDAGKSAYVQANGDFYGVYRENGDYVLAQVDVKTATVGNVVTDLPDYWTVPGSNSYYPGNYSILLAYEDDLYYTTDSGVFRIDLSAAETSSLYTASTGTRVYGMAVKGNLIDVYTGSTPNGPFETFVEVENYIFADVDGNREVNIGDVTALLDYLAGSATDLREQALNVSGDAEGSIDISDVTALLDYLSGRS